MNIVIRLPDKVEERILTFPLLHRIKEVYAEEEPKFYFLCEEHAIEVLYLLPFNAFYFKIQEDDRNSYLKVYRYLKEIKLPNEVDVFINLNINSHDSIMGFLLKAKLKIGFNKTKGSFFYNKKVSYQKGLHQKDLYLSLLQALGESGTNKTLVSRNIPPYFENWKEEPYVLINVEVDEKTKTVSEEWLEFISFFDKIKVFVCSENVKTEEDLVILKNFVNTLDQDNVEVFHIENYIHFSKLSLYSKMFLTHSSSLAYINAYCGGVTYLLNTDAEIQSRGPVGFLGDVKIFSYKDPSYFSQGRFDLGKVYDVIHQDLKKAISIN